MTRFARTLLAAAAALLTALPALAVDGGFTAQDTSYYEQAALGQSLEPAASPTADGAASGGLPSSLYTVEAAGGVTYRSLGKRQWQVDLAVAPRPHERVDAVYDLVLALLLPVGSTSETWSVDAMTAASPKASPLVYSGEPVVLKRNVPLESAWLPLLVGGAQGLPDVSRSGYVWTLWDTIVRYDPAAGETLEAYGSFRYQAQPGTAAPDPDNPNNAAYVITWIPTLEAVPPFAIRLDVAGDPEE
jgi:hypothetical protein